MQRRLDQILNCNPPTKPELIVAATFLFWRVCGNDDYDHMEYVDGADDLDGDSLLGGRATCGWKRQCTALQTASTSMLQDDTATR